MNWVAVRGPNNDLPLETGVYLDYNGPEDSVIVSVEPDWIVVAGPDLTICQIVLEKLPQIYHRWTTVERSNNLEEVAQKIELSSQKLAHLIDATTMEISDDQSASLSPAG